MMWCAACALHRSGRTTRQVGSRGTSDTLCGTVFVSLLSMVVHVPYMLGFNDRATFVCRVPRPRFGVFASVACVLVVALIATLCGARSLP